MQVHRNEVPNDTSGGTSSLETTRGAESPNVHVHSSQTPDGTCVAVLGTVPDEQVAVFRRLLEQAVAGGGPLVLDLSQLQGWGNEAQATLLHLLRHERSAGRVVDVRGLAGTAGAQAEATGMRALLVLPVARRPAPSDERQDGSAAAVVDGARATTSRITQDRYGRRPTARPTCEYGHGADGDRETCVDGHLIVPL
jgi:hypothetical protein